MHSEQSSIFIRHLRILLLSPSFHPSTKVSDFTLKKRSFFLPQKHFLRIHFASQSPFYPSASNHFDLCVSLTMRLHPKETQKPFYKWDTNSRDEWIPIVSLITSCLSMWQEKSCLVCPSFESIMPRLESLVKRSFNAILGGNKTSLSQWSQIAISGRGTLAKLTK